MAFLACLLLARGVLPGWRGLHSDFPNYYLVARLLREGYSLDRIYDWIWLQRIKDHWGLDQSLVGFAGLTPFSALPVLPLAGFAALIAKRFWIVASLLFLFGTSETLQRVTRLGRRRIWILTLLAVIPLRSSFILGQMHILVLILLSLAYFFRLRERGIVCGSLVALAGALKVYPLLFVFYFAWKRQWREALSVVAGTAALLGVSYLCFGSHLMHIYITQILPRSMQGEVIDPYSPQAASAAAFLHRLFILEPDLNPTPVWNRPALYSIFYPLWQVAVWFPLFLSIRPSSRDRDTEKLEWAIFLLALLILSPVPSSYHFVVMILPIILAADVLVKRQQYLRLGIVVLLYFIICNVVGPPPKSSAFTFQTVLAFSRLWIELLLWIVLVICVWREAYTPESRKNILLNAIPLTALSGVFWIAGFTSYQHHFSHLEEDIRSRLRFPIHPLLATGVHPLDDGFVATVMSRSGYQIVDQNGQMAWEHTASDQLSSATTRNQSRVIPELADKGGSRITLGDSPEMQIQNAESPAISTDGALLVYIREEKGRGQLRIAHLAARTGAPALLSDAELVREPYDVRDAALTPSGEVVFSARVNGRTNIYQVTPGSQPAVLIADREEVEAPAVSPDGQQIAFRKLLFNRWQLMTMSVASHDERQLTFGDCNAFAPAWLDNATVAYATDCGRGLGLTALASIKVIR
ncbi:DUF2029 domain-containing protein [Alloacidobacterium dinghuense]|uniref:DUF2029 domain-containing protein n=1 Tax=Alloacidobacterium dinghuense TaxID=2763107 RepID=A0A7G8BFP1_9BACT|nr:glycosyltransferase 87 family protein [Alloacidobacterium dinghuense]QNI31361.1 DUF2029 domain-containing protein [Alloacidobacterium dinghuense]